MQIKSLIPAFARNRIGDASMWQSTGVFNSKCFLKKLTWNPGEVTSEKRLSRLLPHTTDHRVFQDSRGQQAACLWKVHTGGTAATPSEDSVVGGCMSTPCNWSAGRYPALRVARQVPPQARSVTQAFINGGIFSLLAPVLHFCSNRQDAAMICRFWVALWLAWDRWVSVCLRQALSSQALLRRWLQCKVNSPHCCYNPQSPEKPVDGVCAIPVQNHCTAQPEDPALIFTFLLQSLFFLFFSSFFSVFGIRVDPPRDPQI